MYPTGCEGLALPCPEASPLSTQVSNVLQAALDKLCPANHPRIDKHHAAWYPSLPVLLTAWVAPRSLSFEDLQIFSAQFESTLEMPPSAVAPVTSRLSLTLRVYRTQSLELRSPVSRTFRYWHEGLRAPMMTEALLKFHLRC